MITPEKRKAINARMRALRTKERTDKALLQQFDSFLKAALERCKAYQNFADADNHVLTIGKGE